MEVGDPGKVRYPAFVGLPISPFLDGVSRVLHRGGLLGLLSWGEFSPCECWVVVGRVMFIRVIISEF